MPGIASYCERPVPIRVPPDTRRRCASHTLVKAGGDAAKAEWHSVTGLARTKLAFDHTKIVHRGVRGSAERIESSSIAASLVPKTFTIPELRHVYGLLEGKPLDPGNFRRKFEGLMESGAIEEAPGKRITASKPARVSRFILRRGS